MTGAPDHHALTGAEQRWLAICTETLDKAPESLARLLTDDHPYARTIAAGSNPWRDRDVRAPEGRDVPDLSSARAVLAVAEALADPANSAALLEPAIGHWRRALILPEEDRESPIPDAMIEAADPAVKRVLRRLNEVGGAAAGLAALTAAQLTGAKLSRGRSVEIPVLFDRYREGGTAVLRLTVVGSGPPGLYPDPACMLFLVSDAGFQRSLTAAWRAAAPPGSESCVVWSIRIGREPCNDVVHDSLGAAFGAALYQLDREMTRSGRVLRRRLHPRRAVTGGLAPDRTVTPVDGLDNKFAAAAGAGLRIVLPKAQRAEADLLRDRHPALRKRLYFAADIDEVLTKARWFDTRQVVLGAVVVFLLLVAAGGVALTAALKNRDVAHSVLLARAADLSREAAQVKQADPRLAGLLALAAYRLAPEAGGTSDVLRDVLAANENVIRSWKGSPVQVGAIAVDPTRSRVFSAGDDDFIKAWDLRTGAAAGQAEGSAVSLVMSAQAPVLAAVDRDQIRLYNVDSGTPVLQGRLPGDGCASTNSTIVAADFTDAGATLVATWTDGSVSTWDAVSRTSDDCWHLRGTATAKQLGEVKSGRLILDASLVPSENSYLGEEDQLLLLLNQNRVLAAGVHKHRIAVELTGTEAPADATRVRGTKDRIAVGTSSGVLLWDRAADRSLAFPLAGLSTAVTGLDYRDDRLVIASADGAAVVPAFADAAGTGRTATKPHGGPVDVAAVGKDDTIVTGGLGGRISVLRDDAGTLTLPALAPASTLTYMPDGSLLLNDWVQGRSTELFTVRPTGEPDYRAPSGSTYPHLKDYTRSDRFYVNATAASDRYVAGVGQIANRTAVALVWPIAGGDSRELVIPTPDDAVRKPAEQLGVEVEFAPEANLLLARHLSGQVAIWDTTTWKPADPLDLRPGSTAMDVHGTRAVFSEGAPKQTELVLIDLITHRELKRITGTESYRLAWSADGRRIVSLRWGNQIQVYDAELNPLGAPWQLPDGPMGMDVAISPDSTRLAVAQGSRVLVYDLATGAEAMPPLVDPAGNDVSHPTWSPEGSTILARTLPPRRATVSPGPVRRWIVRDNDWTSQICRWTGGGFSRAEWQKQIGQDIDYIDLCAGVKS